MRETDIEITEIHDEEQKDKNVGSNGLICSNPIIPRTEKVSVPSPSSPPSSHETQISKSIKKQRRGDKSTECCWDSLPEDIEHDILSRLNIRDLLRAQLTCHAWRDSILSSHIFQLLYDQRNRETWIALTCDPKDPNKFCLVNDNPSHWYYIEGSYQEDLTKSLILLGAADGLMLFISAEGKLVVLNPLTRRFQILLDTKVSPRLGLQSCLKKKLRQNNSTPSTTAQSSVSIHLVVHGTKFKVMVWGELRTHMVHALVYSSATEKWTVRQCPDINHTLFRRPFDSTSDGDTIIYTSINRSMVAIYNTESGSFVAQHKLLLLPQWQLGMVLERVQNIKLLVHKSRLYLLGIIIGNGFMGRRYKTFLGLWWTHLNGGQWDLLTTHTLQNSLSEAPNVQDKVAAAYDGEQYVTIIPKLLGSKVRILNLDTKEWTVTDEDILASRLSVGNAQPEQITFSAPFMAFYMKLKFCTAL